MINVLVVIKDWRINPHNYLWKTYTIKQDYLAVVVMVEIPIVMIWTWL
jgi:hypothetical protein